MSSQGDVRTEFAYYRNAKTFTNRNALGVGETLDYDLFRKRTRVEDPRGFIQRHFYDRNGQLVKREERDGGIQCMRPTNRVADGAPGSGQARPRCQPSVPSVICRKGLAASRC